MDRPAGYADAMLPTWEPGTVAILSTGPGAPHAIPVSTAIAAGPDAILLALALRRESLARLRDEPRCALTIVAGGDVAVTVHGHATVVEEPLAEIGTVAAIRIDVDAVRDHGQDRFEIDAGVAWHWTDARAAAQDEAVRAALLRLAG